MIVNRAVLHVERVIYRTFNDDFLHSRTTQSSDAPHRNACSTFVNLVPSPLVSLSFSMDRVSVPWTCQLARPIECSCLFGPAYSAKRNLYRSMERRFIEIMERVARRPEFHTDDFTVVYQPFFGHASVFVGDQPKEPDMQIMSIDCVHLSQKGHALAANGLWNNMLQRTGRKRLGFEKMLTRFECPTVERPFLSTYFNE